MPEYRCDRCHGVYWSTQDREHCNGCRDKMAHEAKLNGNNASKVKAREGQ